MDDDGSEKDRRSLSGGINSNPAQAALLSDLGAQHLEKGRVQEAAEYFRQALSLQPEGHTERAAMDTGAITEEAQDDWETGWEDNLSQLSPQKQEVTKQAALTRRFPAAARSGPALPRPKPAAAARSENGRGAADSGSETDDVELPFDGRHILEIIGLTAATTTNDLEGFLSSINTHVLEPAVRWVNNNAALAVFADPAAALAAMQTAADSRYKLRPYGQACEASRQLPNKELQPPRPRPKTSAAIAKRLIGMALNAPNLRDKSAEEHLRQQRKSNCELKKERQRQVDATWEND